VTPGEKPVTPKAIPRLVPPAKPIPKPVPPAKQEPKQFAPPVQPSPNESLTKPSQQSPRNVEALERKPSPGVVQPAEPRPAAPPKSAPPFRKKDQQQQQGKAKP
jgi:hypothetical protein